ncbi:hypothetical protein Golob_022325, partial [Gossypium lobatum]|nr:hypothetical protein [Gossypium lobatum]
ESVLCYGLLAQLVPKFSATLRKENRKPLDRSGMELTSPPTLGKNWSIGNGEWQLNSMGNKFANEGEKKRGNDDVKKKEKK